MPLEPGKDKLLLLKHPVYCILDFPDGSVIKNAPDNTGEVPSLGREDPLEKEMATHSSILAWEIPCTEELGGLQSMGSQRVGHNLGINNNYSILLQQSRQNEIDQAPHWKGDLFLVSFAYVAKGPPIRNCASREFRSHTIPVILPNYYFFLRIFFLFVVNFVIH